MHPTDRKVVNVSAVKYVCIDYASLRSTERKCERFRTISVDISCQIELHFSTTGAIVYNKIKRASYCTGHIYQHLNRSPSYPGRPLQSGTESVSSRERAALDCCRWRRWVAAASWESDCPTHSYPMLKISIPGLLSRLRRTSSREWMRLVQMAGFWPYWARQSLVY